jgi:hypothetical protein
VLILDELSDSKRERELSRFPDAVDDGANYKLHHRHGGSSDNNTNNCHSIAADEKPSPPKDVRQPSNKGIAHCHTERSAD